MKYKFFSIFVCICVALSVVFGIQLSRAQEKEPVNITVSPSLFDLTATSSGVIKETVRIKNNASVEQNYLLTVTKLSPRGDNGDSYPDETATDDYLQWVKFETDQITAPPNEWVEVPFIITIPEDAAFGYYFALRVLVAGENELSPGAALQGQVIIPLLLNVRRPGAVTDLRLEGFKAESYISEYLPVNFQVVLRNAGNIHLKPLGNIFIKDAWGNDLGNLPVNSSRGNVLPDSRRSFTAQWTDGFLVLEPIVVDGQVKMDKNGKPKTRLKFNWDAFTHFRFGKYSAELVMIYDSGERDEVIKSQTDFWIIQYKIIIAVVVSLTLFISIIVYLVKWYIRREIRKRTRNS